MGRRGGLTSLFFILSDVFKDSDKIAFSSGVNGDFKLGFKRFDIGFKFFGFTGGGDLAEDIE